MARPYVCVLILAALLLLGFATISRSKYPSGKERQRASRIPSQFSQEERVAMKEALKGEPGSPTATCAQIWVSLSLLRQTYDSPLTPRRIHCNSSSATPQPRPRPLLKTLCPCLGLHASPDLASGDFDVPCLAWKLQLPLPPFLFVLLTFDNF